MLDSRDRWVSSALWECDGAGRGHKWGDCMSSENSEHIIHTTDGHAHKKTRTMHTENRCSARSHTDTVRATSALTSRHTLTPRAPHPSLGAVSRTETRGATRCDARCMRPTCRALSLSRLLHRRRLASLSLSLSLSRYWTRRVRGGPRNTLAGAAASGAAICGCAPAPRIPPPPSGPAICGSYLRAPTSAAPFPQRLPA